jgi:CRP-like cAMP-binding protein
LAFGAASTEEVLVSERPISHVDNRLLALLPQEEHEGLLSNLEQVPLDFKQVLYEPGSLIEFAYFPLSGVISSVAIMEDGLGVSVAMIGNEGMVGLRAFLGADVSPQQVIVQVPGQAMRMAISLLREEIRGGGSLFQTIYRYLNAFLTQVMQSVACQTLHPLEKRCCRWLLMAHDRVRADQFPLTHGLLAHMLGVRRASVTEVARRLQKAGLIDYIHGKVTVLDREGLERASCECYRAVKNDFDQLLSGQPQNRGDTKRPIKGVTTRRSRSSSFNRRLPHPPI